MGRKNYQAIILGICCLLAACKKDKPEPASTILPGSTGNVYIVCEGSYPNGNSSLYAYQPLHDSVFTDVYKNANNQPLGDVFQSMERIGDKYFLCINNSNKVVVINAGDKKQVASIAIPQPRYILPVSSTKAYVSTLYSNKVYIINTQDYSVTSTITLPNMNPEGMCLYDGNAYICTWDTTGNNVYKTDPATDQPVQTIKTIGYAPQAAVVDKEQTMWILAGNQAKGRTATLTRIDPSTGAILRSYTFPAMADVMKPVFNNTKDTLYFIEVNYNGGTDNNGIYRMSIHDATLPAQPFVAAKQLQYFWALGIDPATGNIYIGDPKGFVQSGSVYIYQPDGTQIRSFNVGIGPGHFCFD